MIAIFRKLFHLPLLVLSVLELPFSSGCSVDVQMFLYSSSCLPFFVLKFSLLFLPFLLLVGSDGQQAALKGAVRPLIYTLCPPYFSNSQLFSVEIIPLHLRMCLFLRQK